MNSSKRGGVYGFRLQSLDIVSSKKSCLRKEIIFSSLKISSTRAPSDKSTTLVSFVAGVVREKFPHILEFVSEVTYLEKAAAGKSST